MNRFSEKINTGFQKEFNSIINSLTFFDYRKVLESFYNGEEIDLTHLIEYGVSHLPNEDNRPALELASYFQILSEIKNIPVEVRDYLMDAMLYCESSKDEPIVKNFIQLRQSYTDDLEPLIKDMTTF
jgi:hypothetical protein